MKEHLVDKEYLKTHRACKEGSDWWVRNGLEDFPVGRVSEIEGDYRRYVDWLKTRPKIVYDSKGNIASKVFPSGKTNCYTYSDKGYLLHKTVARNNKLLEEYFYNNERSITAYNSSTLRDYTCTYDSNGNRSTQIFEGGWGYTWTYNKEGKVLTKTSHKGNTQKWNYNKEGWLITHVSYDGKVTKYTHDKKGNVVSETLSGKVVIRFTYDDVGNMLTKTVVGGCKTVYTYCSKNGETYRSSQKNPHFEQHFNSNGNVTLESYLGGVTCKYIYDNKGNLVSKILSDGETKNWTYTSDDKYRLILTEDNKTILKIPK